MKLSFPFICIIFITIFLSACGGTVTDREILTPPPTLRPRRLLPGELVLAASPGDIPAIFASDDLFVDEKTNEWLDSEIIIGVEINGDARAYPIRLLSLHEIVNDVIGGKPVAVTWCPLCYSALVFERVVEDTELTFGVSGYLYHNNLVLYDHQSNGLWSQLLAQGIKGAHRGEYLTVLPSVLTTWGEWKQAHTHARILSAERMGRDAESIIDPYSGYYLSGSTGLTGASNVDERLARKSLVVGIQIGEETRAYPLESIKAAGTINDDIGTTSLLLIYDEKISSVLVYKVGAEEALTRIISPLVFWFAWSDIHPETTLYTMP